MEETDYSATTFLEDSAFRQWVRAPTPGTDAYWREFMRQHPGATDGITKAREALRLMDARTETDFPTNEQIQRMKGIIKERTEERPVRPLWSPVWRWAAAASVALIVGLGWWFQMHQTSSDTLYQQLTAQAETPLLEKVNTGSQSLLVNLPDGSTVALQPKSRISYALSLANNSRREVYLAGEAFFEVVKDPQRPFLVYANELVTKVVGTSFWVKAIDQEQKVTVSVRTGRVAVFSRTDAAPLSANREQDEVMLTPNQQLVFDRQYIHMQKTLVPQPELVNSAASVPTFEYRDAPVSQAFSDLKNAYGINIDYDETAMKHCLLTASLTDEPLYEKLKLICKGIQAQYQIQDDHIVITGQGCP
ncbi:FecR family protein [Spirosoma endophyticum]|uniref:FecR family protein n=2 Tax=Spirosoma endophyticum TaxID=662367 RepID=A0A1I2GIC7_9BACT|nr:FecR family protein [Spirosoma endophyticum]